MLEGRAVIQKNPDKLEGWTDRGFNEYQQGQMQNILLRKTGWGLTSFGEVVGNALCAAFGWVRVNFLNDGWYGAVIWICAGGLII